MSETGILVLVEVVAKPDCFPQLVQSLKAGLPHTRAADGCLDLHTYVEGDGRTVVAVEHWQSKEHYERYLAWRVESGVLD
ncbi:MAG: antibiotic biosynthesis monooxygenase family protein, partial [Acidobacteriota bacterium]